MTAYLCTVDAHAFYSRLGYSLCPPVCSYGGSLHLPERFWKSVGGGGGGGGGMCGDGDGASPPKEEKKSAVHPARSQVNVPNSAASPPPPPPPPPPAPSPPAPPPPPARPDTAGGSKPDESVAELCSRLFKRTTLGDLDVSLLKSAPRALPEESPKTVNSANKAKVCRATLPKEFMKKEL